MTGTRRRVWIAVGSIFAIAIAVSLHARLAYITGGLDTGAHHWLTASTVKYVENWIDDGVVTDLGLLLERPRSIETPDLASREVYSSFLPGFAFAAYLAHRLAPDMELVTAIGLLGIFNQILVCIVCGLIVHHAMSRQESGWIVGYFVSAAMLFYLLHPLPAYFHAMVYQGYQAALLPFGVAVLLEAKIRSHQGEAARLSCLLALVIAWLSFVDWVWIPFCLVLSVLRVLIPLRTADRRNPLARLTGAFLAIWFLPLALCGTYFMLLLWSGNLDALVSKALMRAGMAAGASPSFAEFYQRVFVENLGRYRLIAHATLVLGILLLWRRPRDSAVLVCVLALSTCYLYAALLRNDVTTHSFSTLRFFLPLAIAAVAIVPYRVMQLAVDRSPGRRGVVKSVMMAGVALFSGLYVFDLRDWPGIGEGWRGWYLIQLRQERPPETLELAIWLRANARYEEVYFSRQWAIQENPPMAVAISRKLVWHVESSLAHYVGTLPRGAVPRFVGSSMVRECIAGEPLVILSDRFLIYDGTGLTPAELDCLDRLPGKR